MPEQRFLENIQLFLLMISLEVPPLQPQFRDNAIHRAAPRPEHKFLKYL